MRRIFYPPSSVSIYSPSSHRDLNHMKLFLSSLSLLLVLTTTIIGQMNKKYIYPEAKKVDQVDDFHGTKVADPYRWLENPDSEQSRAWIEAENKVTFDFLNQIPEREKIKARLTKLWDFEKFSPPFKEGAKGS